MTNIRLGTLALLVAATSACQGPAGTNGTNGTSCTVTKNGDGTATISCTDGTNVIVANGTDGTDCTVTGNTDGGIKTITCSDGTTVTVSDGKPCSLKDNGDGTKTITCADGSKITVSDGEKGLNGGNVEVANFHGTAHMLSEGEFETAGKFFATAAITGATADSAGVVTVQFTVADGAGKPYTYLASVSANIAKLLPPAAGESFSKWVPYIYRKQEVTDSANGNWPNPDGTSRWQGTTDSGGTFTNHGDGSYTYVFKNNISNVMIDNTAITYERNRKHRVSIMMGGHSGATADANFDFVPDGSTVGLTRSIVQTSACKSCHGIEFHGHGGNRLSVDNCVTCHNPSTEDPHGGETVDFKVMIHKIHAGGELASIAGADGKVWDDPATVANEAADNGSYAIWGNRNTKYEWWKAGFPAIIENCTKCHQGNGADVDNWKTVPSRAACGSCHDNVNFATGANHPTLAGAPSGNVQTSDDNCTACHDGSAIVDAHDWVKHDPRKIPEFLGEISISTPGNGTHFVAGESPVVTVKLRDNEVNGNPYIDHTTVVADDGVTSSPPGDGPEGCLKTGCPQRDGKFTTAALFVHGPRARRVPVLTTKARVALTSVATFPVNISDKKTTSGLTSETSSLIVKVDQGKDLWVTSGGTNNVKPGNITVPLVSTGYSGRVTAVNGAEITDSFEFTWVDHQFAGFTFQITDGTGKNQTATVVDNVGNKLTLDAALATAPDTTTSTYRLTAVTGSTGGIVTAVPSTTSATVSGSTNWSNNRWKGFRFKIIAGTGVGQSVLVTGNTGGTLAFASALATQPDTTSVFLLTPIADVTAATADELATWLNAYSAFKDRALAWVSGGKLSVRSRNLGDLYALQFLSSYVNSVVFNKKDAGGNIVTTASSVVVIGGSTVGNSIAKQTDATKNDPKVAWYADRIEYTLDPVDDLAPGTYIVDLEIADRGNFDDNNFKTPTVPRVTFQVKTATAEKAPADKCGSCHTDPTDTKGMVVDARRHNKLLNNTAVDLCGNCHDYQTGAATGDWNGARPISKRVHAIHYGSSLNYPLQTVWYGNGDPVKGRNWDITLPQDVRYCDGTCHTSSTSGSWKTNPNTIACWGCHDSDAAVAHFRALTWDPTPVDPYSGDEVEACKACH